ncbi:MAG: response regulator, partial [Flavobacteriaceae bacterium]|nr:response regulator [Flavobacteriaceae bacterium]
MSAKMKLKAIIIDDEVRGRNSLAILIKNYVPDVEIVGEAASVKEGTKLIHELSPNMIFLDIEMPEENGFAIYNEFPEPDFQVIFVTAYNQYLVKALRHSALDYLLKPIDLDELSDAIERAQKKIHHTTKEQVTILDDAIKSNEFKKIALPTKDGLMFVETDDIIRCEADGSYTNFHLKNKKKVMVSSLLGSYEKVLSNHF